MFLSEESALVVVDLLCLLQIHIDVAHMLHVFRLLAAIEFPSASRLAPQNFAMGSAFSPSGNHNKPRHNVGRQIFSVITPAPSGMLSVTSVSPPDNPPIRRLRHRRLLLFLPGFEDVSYMPPVQAKDTRYGSATWHGKETARTRIRPDVPYWLAILGSAESPTRNTLLDP